MEIVDNLKLAKLRRQFRKVRRGNALVQVERIKDLCAEFLAAPYVAGAEPEAAEKPGRKAKAGTNRMESGGVDRAE